MSTKQCVTCSTSFVAKRQDQKYCSYQCGKKAWDRKKAEERRSASNNICPVCGITFEPYYYNGRQTYCSTNCKFEVVKAQKREANRQRLETNPNTCEQCNNQFIAYRQGQRFCSKTCKQDYHKEQDSLRREEIRKSTIRTCPICEKQFSPQKSMKEIYCSKYCRQVISKKIYKMLSSCLDRIGTEKEDHAHNILGYTPVQLLSHLQTHPNWAAVKRGRWHLDHKFPIIAFVRKGIKDLKLICALDNLQPLPGSDNCSKNDNYDEEKFDVWLAGHRN